MSDRTADSARPRRAAVVGSGFGGLAAAIRLQASGFDTVLFEARDKPGGRAYVYEQDGFTFDAGPTVITAPNALEELFALSGRRMQDYVELLPVTPFYRLLWEDGDSFDYSNDVEALERQIAERNPDDVEGYRRFLDYSKRVFEVGYEGLADAPFLRFRDMVRVAPALMKFRADRPVYKTVARFLKDPKLREAFSFHALLVGGNPFETSSIYTLIHYLERNWGVFFPRGGTGALVRALVRLFEDTGGELRLSSPVRRVDVEDVNGGTGAVHRVTTDEHEAEAFDLLVSNADVHTTYAKLYQSESRAAPMVRKLERMDWSMSLFVLYFGTDRTYEDVAHHTVLFGPRYKGLLRDVFHGNEVPEDFSLYLHAPTRSDPSLAPPGCEAFYVLSPVPHLGKAKVDWESFAPEYADKLLASMERTLPDLRKHVITQRAFTPLDFESELAAYQGSAFSVAPKLTQSAWFRPHNKDDRIPGLYIVGAGTHPGAGVPGVVNTAKATVRCIMNDLDLPPPPRTEQTPPVREELPA
ncbi:MAG: phytoene desaturase [Planctomycetota bacterium]|nr:phytoene desaturase [Planctomycetota bacterium]